MAEKNDDSGHDNETGDTPRPPLRPVDPPASSASSSEPDWMDGLVSKEDRPAEPSAHREPSPAAEPETERPDWAAGLTDSEPAPPRASEPFAPVEDEDELFDDSDIVPAETSRNRPLPGWVKPAGIGLMVVAFVGVFGAIAAQAFGGSEEPSEQAEVQALDEKLAQESIAPSSAPVAFTCDESSSGDTETGHGEGDRKSVAGVVFAFHHAYYEDRDAKKIAELMAEDSPFREDEAVKTLQEGIDTVPADTDYCVSVTPDGDKASVEVTEAQPKSAEETFVQEFTTKRDGDKVSIADVVEE